MPDHKKQRLLTVGSLLRNRYRVEEQIGRGGYGQIYQAMDELNNIVIAIKAEPTHRKGKLVRRMILEQRILLLLQGKAHAPVMLQSGLEGGVNFIVMQKLSRNIGQFRKESPIHRLSKSTCARILQQAIAGLRDLHQIGFVHRDLKPANICFGCSPTSRHRLFIIDYGLTRRYRMDNGDLRPARKNVGFRGTLRYASLRVHRHQEASPADDLMSLFYTFIELLHGSLSWRTKTHFSEVRMAKEQLEQDQFRSVADPINECIRELGLVISSLNYEDEPPYTLLQELVNEMVGGHSISDLYDWEDDYMEVCGETEINRALGFMVSPSVGPNKIKSRNS